MNCNQKYEKYSNEHMSDVIDLWVKGKRNREIAKKKLIDLITYEKIAEEYELSPRHVKSIVHHAETVIFNHL